MSPASLINWTASEGGLKVNSPVAHDFYPVPGVPQEYGTSILYWKGEGRNSTNQNLYLENNLSLPILLTFTAESQTVKLRIQKVNS